MPRTLDIAAEPCGFNPEPIEQLRARWQDAVAEEHKMLDPLEPKNVFDFFDGLRLMVTLERPVCGKERLSLHVAADVHSGTLMGDRLRNGRGFNEFVAHARQRLCGLCDELAESLSTEDGANYRNPQIVLGGMPHWLFPCKGERHG